MTDAPSYAQLSQGRIEYRWFGHRDRILTLVLLYYEAGLRRPLASSRRTGAARTAVVCSPTAATAMAVRHPLRLAASDSYMHADDARTVLPELLRHLDTGTMS